MIQDTQRPFKPQDGDEGRYAFVPKPMREADRWAVAGKWERRNGKDTNKAPHDAKTEQDARSNDPATWASFDEACAVIDDPATPYDRLYFAAGDGFAFADFDDCVDDGKIHTAVTEAVADADSYAEVSPSGNGVRIWATTADTSQEWRKHYATPWGGAIEVYKAGQFGSVTGKVLHDAPLNDNGTIDALMRLFPKPVVESDAAAPDKPVSPAMDDDEVLRRLRGGKNGERFSDLFDNPPESHDASTNDLALASLITFYTQDAEQVERIMRMSGRYRDKWDTHATYLRERTIERALIREDFWTPGGREYRASKARGDEGEASGHTSEANPFFTFVNLATVSPEPPEMLIDGLLVKNARHQMYGPTAVGKTILAMHCAAQVLRADGTVWYADKENAPRILAERFKLMGVDLRKFGPRFQYLADPLAINDKEALAQWRELIADHKPDLVVFDSLIGFLADFGAEENDATSLEAWSGRYMRPVLNNGGTCLVLDHTGKDESRGSRGSSRKPQIFEVAYKVSKIEDFSRDKVGRVSLARVKDRESVTREYLEFRIGGEPGSVDGSRLSAGRLVCEPLDGVAPPEDTLNAGQRMTLERLVGRMSRGDWLAAATHERKLSESGFDKHREALVRAKVVEYNPATREYWRPCKDNPTSPTFSVNTVSTERQDRTDYRTYPNNSMSWGKYGSTDGGSVVDSKPALNIGTHGYPTTPDEYPDGIADLADQLETNGWSREVVNAALRRRGVSPPPDVGRLCVDVEASAIAAGNAEIERQGLEPTIAAIDWHAVWAAETGHVITCIKALRRAGHEHAALALMRKLPAPPEPADDVQEEWAMLNRPFDYHMYERTAYASYAESVTDYPMGAAMVSTGYPLKSRKTESDRLM